MIETLIAQTGLWNRIQANAGVLTWFPEVDADHLPLYLDVAPADAPDLYMVATVLGQDDTLTQEKSLAYAEVEIDFVVTAEDRGMDQRPSATAQVWGLGEDVTQAVKGDLLPYQVTEGGGVYEVTSDRISGRSFAVQEGGTLVRRVALRFLFRVQRIA